MSQTPDPTDSVLEIDGSMGEGGGQVLRSSLSLSMLTGKPFRMTRIRAGRKKPGLLRQHLTAVLAARAVCGGSVEGAELRSSELSFWPGTIHGGDYEFSIGTAGSTTLVFQTLLPALLRADAPATLRIAGGTHNPMAPSFDFLERAFLPLLGRMGAHVECELESYGFYPAGGGAIRFEMEPVESLQPLRLDEPAELRHLHAGAHVAKLPEGVARREVDKLAAMLGTHRFSKRTSVLEGTIGPGNFVHVDVLTEHATEVFTAIGQLGVPAETVAGKLGREVRKFLAAGVPVGPHLADQLLLPIALAGSGSFLTLPPTLHTRTNCEVIRVFLGLEFQLETTECGATRISL